MADNSNTLQLTLQIKDDGTIVIDQAVGKIKGMGDETDKAASKSSGVLSKLKDNWLFLTAGITAAYFAITRVTESIYTNIKTAASLTNEIDRQAQVIGVSTDAFQKYQFIAKMSDVSNDNLGIGLKMLSRNMEEVSRGTGLTKDYFDAMGISVTGASGKLKPLDQIMGEIADKFSTWEDGPRKIAIAMELFGRSGETLIPMLNKGKSGFEELSREAEKLGIILSPGIVQKGSEAEDIFKRLEARAEALKKSFYPAAFEFTKTIDSMLRDFNRLDDWLKKNKATDWFPWLTQANKWMKDNSLDNWLTKVGLKIPKVSYDIKQLTKDMIPAPTVEPIKPPDPNLLQEWLATYHQETDAMRALGTTSQSSFREMGKAAMENLTIVKNLFVEDKRYALDYANALKAVKDILDKLKPADTSKQRLATEVGYEEAMKKIRDMEPGPEKEKARGEILDKYIADMKEISKLQPPSIVDIPKLEQDVAKSKAEVEKLYGSFDKPIVPGVDTSYAIIQLDGIEKSYNEIKNRIESNPISVPISGGGGGGAGAEISSEGSQSEANINFTATGLSPKIPLGSAFDKIESRFKTIQEKSQAMEAVIQFQGLSNQLRDLQKQNDLVVSTTEKWVKNARGSTVFFDINKSPYIQMLKGLQEDLFYQMKTYKMQMAEQKYLMGLPGSEEEFYSIFKSKFNAPVYQHGIDYVPETGLALVHKGEKITPANQNFSMGGMVFNIEVKGGGREAAEEIAHVLEYQLSGRLREAIKRIK